MPYTTLQKLLDAGNPPGPHNYWKAEFIRALGDDAIDTLVAHAAPRESPMSKVFLGHLGGAVSRIGEEETAYSHRAAPFLLTANAMWSDPNESDRHIGWARDFWQAMQPFSAGGVYANFLSNKEKIESGLLTRRGCINGWWRSRISTTRPTSSASTRTSSQPSELYIECVSGR